MLFHVLICVYFFNSFFISYALTLKSAIQCQINGVFLFSFCYNYTEKKKVIMRALFWIRSFDLIFFVFYFLSTGSYFFSFNLCSIWSPIRKNSRIQMSKTWYFKNNYIYFRMRRKNVNIFRLGCLIIFTLLSSNSSFEKKSNNGEPKNEKNNIKHLHRNL